MVQPAALAQRTKRSRPWRSRSVKAMRQPPPFSVPPISASSIRLDHSRSGSIFRLGRSAGFIATPLSKNRYRTKFGPSLKDTSMPRASRIKPISYFKANAAEIIEELGEVGEPMIITQNGEATAVIQDIATYEQTQQTLAMLKIIALGEQQAKEGKTISAAEAMRRFRDRIRRTTEGE